MNENSKAYFERSIRWLKTHNPLLPYSILIDNQTWMIRVNDFPEEALYTLIIDGNEIADFDAWPKAWQRT